MLVLRKSSSRLGGEDNEGQTVFGAGPQHDRGNELGIAAAEDIEGEQAEADGQNGGGDNEGAKPVYFRVQQRIGGIEGGNGQG